MRSEANKHRGVWLVITCCKTKGVKSPVNSDSSDLVKEIGVGSTLQTCSLSIGMGTSLLNVVCDERLPTLKLRGSEAEAVKLQQILTQGWVFALSPQIGPPRCIAPRPSLLCRMAGLAPGDHHIYTSANHVARSWCSLADVVDSRCRPSHWQCQGCAPECEVCSCSSQTSMPVLWQWLQVPGSHVALEALPA